MANRTSIKIGHLKITDHLILGITKLKFDQGAETFRHSTLETQAMMGWNQVADALAGGAISAAFVLAPTAMDLFKAGVKIKLVLYTHKTGSVLITNKRAGIKTLDDFKDKVVIIPYQLSVHNMLLHKMLTEHGLKPGTGRDPDADVKLEVMAPSQMPEAIQFDEEGEIAGFIVAEPFGSQAVLAGYGEEYALSKNLWPDHPCCVLAMKEELTEGHPEACLELVKSLQASGAFVEKNPEGAATLGAPFLNQSQEVVQRVLTTDRIKTGELFPIIDDLAVMQDYMHGQMGILKSKIDLEKFVDPRFAKEAGAR